MVRVKSMSSALILKNSLVLYKNRPARVLNTGERVEIETESGVQKVRLKDLLLLHPGPLNSLAELHPLSGDVHTAWEILSDLPGEHNLEELAELIYGAYTPDTAWAAWWWVADGLYFYGSPQALSACTPDQILHEQAARQAKAVEAKAWLDFLERARAGRITPQDRPFLRDVEDLAWGRRTESRVLRDLGRSESPETAHALLLHAGIWEININPHPARLGMQLTLPDPPLSDLPDEQRLDLTHQLAFAIDDPGNQEPDDAISLDGERLWVHVADAAALVSPDSPADMEARSRGATLYLPEGSIPMLPSQAIQRLGLGLNQVSPALSFGLQIDSGGELAGIEIVPSWVRVQRLTYPEADLYMDEDPFAKLYRRAMRYQERRRAAGAGFIELPETKMRVVDGVVDIYPILPMRSRDCVQEAMLMAGEAAARYALEHTLPLPFASQDPPDPQALQEMLMGDPWRVLNMSEMYALRRLQRRGQIGVSPSRHAGLGLPAYTRATSPLRRYLDLVVHQQLRLHLSRSTLLSEMEILERVGASEAVVGGINQAELLSERHWTLVYLLQHPGWQGEGVLVEKRGLRGKFILPELALETQLHLRQDLPLDSRMMLMLKDVNLAELEAYFQVLDSPSLR